MNLYIVQATYQKNADGKPRPFKFYVIAEDEFEASDKISKAINESPDEMDNWYLEQDPIAIASNDCGTDIDLIIE